ncbi:MAG: (d)CMP kinase [Actinomycetaceae bacterium]|nr:(d)CMP kinase [Actinomycetaceae bacterium]
MAGDGSEYVGQQILGKGLVVAIDGPSGAGKSTVARLAAAELYLNYLDTGAMYRALTLYVLKQGVDPDDEPAVTELARTVPMTVEDVAHAPRVLLDGKNVTNQLHSKEVNQAVSTVAAYPGVRAELINFQRHLIQAAVNSGRGIVAEGRDMTTVVVPGAQVRILITASEEVRKQRRAAQSGMNEDSIEERDRKDSEVNEFMEPAPGVSVIDTTHMTEKQVVDQIVFMVGHALKAEG